MSISSIVFISFVILILNSLHYKRNGEKSGLLDKNSVECIRGISAILIVFSHAHFYTEELGLLRILKPFGYIGVSVFFFCSGYGVMKQWIRDTEYMNGFLIKRVKSIYIPYFVAVIIWLLFILITDSTVGYKGFLKQLLGSLSLINNALPFAWYVKAILVWYVLFWSVVMIQKRPNRVFATILTLNLIWYVVGVITKVDSFYYNGTCCISLGCYIALVEDKLTVPKFRYLFIVGAAFGFSILFLYAYGSMSGIIYSISIVISSLCFLSVLYLVSFVFDINSTCTHYLGRYSYEIYLSQGIAYYGSTLLIGADNKAFWLVFGVILMIISVLVKKITFLIKKVIE